MYIYIYIYIHNYDTMIIQFITDVYYMYALIKQCKLCWNKVLQIPNTIIRMIIQFITDVYYMYALIKQCKLCWNKVL